MLKNIPTILNPELLKILMEMGHGDEIVIGDGNFPAASMGRRVVRCDGNGACEVLDAILRLFPLDQYVEKPLTLMALTPGDDVNPVIWEEFKRIAEKHEPENCKFEHMERFAFYERAKSAYAVVSTGEGALYANIILKKGVVK
ncbi:MAG: L-fucose mutarotase [Christensenellales bacterium]